MGANSEETETKEVIERNHLRKGNVSLDRGKTSVFFLKRDFKYVIIIIFSFYFPIV